MVTLASLCGHAFVGLLTVIGWYGMVLDFWYGTVLVESGHVSGVRAPVNLLHLFKL